MAPRPEHDPGSRTACVLLTALFVFAAAGLLDLAGPDSPRVSPVAAASAASDPTSGDTVASESDRRYQAARRAKRVERLWIVAAAVYVPPFVLLLFGWIIAGVVRRLRAVWQH